LAKKKAKNCKTLKPSKRVLGKKTQRVKEIEMNGAGAPDFFYREAQRLGYVARSAFKVLPFSLCLSLLKFSVPFSTLTHPSDIFLCLGKNSFCRCRSSTS